MAKYFLKMTTLALMALLLFAGGVFAKEKPEIIRADAQYLDKAVSIIIQWQSPNPIVYVRAFAGKDQKEVKVDEYDNRRNRDGYSGEVTVLISVDPRLFQDFVSYVVQIEDDLRQKSEQVTGKLAIASVKGKDDDWGKEKVEGRPAQAQGQQSGDMIDKLLGVIERHDTPPSIEKIHVNLLGPGTASFSTSAIDDKGLREINFKIFDSGGAPVQNQTLTNLGKIWKGTSQVFILASGNYRVVAQAVDNAGNTSPERSENFTITGGAQPQPPAMAGLLVVTVTPQPAIDAGAQWRADNGTWMKSGDNVSIAAGQHTVEFRDVAGWTKPVTQSVAVQTGQTSNASGIYVQGQVPVQVGALSVFIIPQAAIDAGAQWRVDNGQWMNSGDNSTAVPAGQHTVEFRDVTGWTKPAALSVNVQANQAASASGAYGRVYTIDKDFGEGTIVGLEYQTVHDQLQLSKTSTTLPFIWVPNSNDGSISKVDSRTGTELGRYMTGPGSNGSPSRTTVDLKGNCWVGNRNTGTVVKVGLAENGQCVDRNGNGKIETSTGSTALPWGQDECVIFEVLLSVGKENTYSPGDYKGPYDSAPGPRGVAVDANNNVWLGTYGTHWFYYIDSSTGKILRKINVSSANHGSYGAVVDANGILWSADIGQRHVLRLDPNSGTFNAVSLGHMAYGMGLDKNNHLFVAGWTDNKLSMINTVTGKLEWTKAGESGCRGVAVTNDGDVWVANSFSNTVTRWSNNGDKKASVPGMNHPTGVAVDADGKVWVVNNGDAYIKRIDPATNRIDLEKSVGSPHYGYSDMTGIVARTSTTKLGTWTVAFDSKSSSTKWGIVSWNSTEPQGTVVKVRVRSSGDQKSWGPWEDVTKGNDLKATSSGRYLQAEVTLQVMSGDASPVMQDMTVIAKQN